MISKTKDGSLISKNIYVDKKGRVIYYKKSQNTGYVITPGSENTFFTLSSRAIAALVAIAFVTVFSPSLWFVGLAIGAVVYGYMENKFRKLLSTYPQIQGFDPSKFKSTEETQVIDKKKFIIKTVLSFVIAVLLVINAFTSPDIKDSNILIAANCIVAVAFLYYGVIGVMKLNKKK